MTEPLPPGVARLTYVGHGTVLIETGGARILTDPLLRRRMGPLFRRGPLPDPALLADLDAVLISHLHIDHLDAPSLRRLDPGTPVVVPTHGARLLRQIGFSDVRTLRPRDTSEVGGLRVEATASWHRGKRYPMTQAGDALGYLVGDGPTFYFAGDTGLFPGLSSLAGRVDVALLPISGWGTTLPGDHLDPLGAAKALASVRPAIAVPIHWGVYYPPGMLAVYRDHDVKPPRKFSRYAAMVAPEVEVRVLQPGESTVIAPAS